ncbi:hypothetical protein ACWDFL_37390 [Streptomyces bungoensis]
MEAQRWRRLGTLEARCPTIANIAVSITVFLTLHPHPDIPEGAAVGLAFAALDCLRYRRTPAVGPHLELRDQKSSRHLHRRR